MAADDYYVIGLVHSKKGKKKVCALLALLAVPTNGASTPRNC